MRSYGYDANDFHLLGQMLRSMENLYPHMYQT